MIEFERRFFVNEDMFSLSDLVVNDIYQIRQGYVCGDNNSVVRIRRRSTKRSPPSWFLTIKTVTKDIGKVQEFEYSLPDASELFNTLTQKIEKTRYLIQISKELSLYAEVDMFHRDLEGLMIVEVELTSEEDSCWLSNNLPAWFGKEITHLSQYSNYNLCKHGLPKEDNE